MCLVKEALVEALEEYFPTRKEEYELFSIEELLLFLKNNMDLEEIECIQGRFMDLLDIKHAEEDRVIETGECDHSIPLPKNDELEDPPSYNLSRIAHVNGKNDD